MIAIQTTGTRSPSRMTNRGVTTHLASQCKSGRDSLRFGTFRGAQAVPTNSVTCTDTCSRSTTTLGNPEQEELSCDRPTKWKGPKVAPPTNDTVALKACGSHETRVGNPSDEDLQRAQGFSNIVVTGSERGTRIKEVFQRSPIRMLFPRIGGATIEEAVLVNTAGGIAGGDRLEFGVTALAGAAIAVTSQAAEKIYQAVKEPARITTKLKAQEGARLAWLPQETIIFDHARIMRNTEIEVSSGAELLALEWILLGRAAHDEEVVGGYMTDGWLVKKDGRLIWADKFRVTDRIFPHLHRKALLSDCKGFATLIYFGPHVDKRLEWFRAIVHSLGCDCAATSVGGLIIIRLAAKLSSHMRLALRTLLQQFSSEFGRGPFRVPRMWSC